MSLTDIAIVGMAIRCPGADNLDEFWANLDKGVESISVFSPDELEPSGFLPVDRNHPDFVPAAGIIGGADTFDDRFFGISPAEAAAMDPQHRLFLETAWTAMEDSGHDLTTYEGNVAVYAGSASNTYLLSMLPGAGSRLRSYQGLVGNEKDYLATRVSYKLNLSGESVTVQTACSTSLVAVHLACQSILSGQSDVAIAGGVSVQANQKTGYIYQEDAIFSPDGHCRAFSENAEGTVFSNGLGAVVLRRLEDAVSDRDRIYGVIKGTAVNNDANAKVSYTAPSVDAQAAVIAAALEFADCTADTIGYVEAHGTATPIGDPIEVEALSHAFQQSTDKRRYCALGSVKTNVGHLNVAAGVAGLIKTALVLHHGRIPASLGFSAPNPEIDFDNSPFFVNTEARPWPRGPHPRRAGVSSFGIGGTNAHAVLEEAPEQDIRSEADRPIHVLAISAKNGEALALLARQHSDHLAGDDTIPLGDYSFTVNTGRAQLQHRAAVWGHSQSDLVSSLDALADGRSTTTSQLARASGPTREPKLGFLFTGQGAQYPGMAIDLYDNHPVFRQAIDECQELLRPSLDLPLLEYLLPDGAPAAELSRTSVAQPAIFAVEHALVHLWSSWGVRPTAVVGHSLGELVAASVAGIFPLPDALRLVSERGRLMEELPKGAMAAVFASEDEVMQALSPVQDLVSVAAVNGRRNTVISGEVAAVERMVVGFENDGVLVQRLDSAYGFHSPLVDPILEELQHVVGQVSHQSAEVPFVTGSAGGIVAAGCSLPQQYWVDQARMPVRFADGLGALVDFGVDALVEIGPDPVLTKLARRIFPVDDALFVPSLERDEPDWDTMAASLGTLYAAGTAVDWGAFDEPFARRRATSATYPFQRRRHWLDHDVDKFVGAVDEPESASGSSAALPPERIGAEHVTAGVPRLERITAHLQSLAARILDVPPHEVDVDTTLSLLGLDSLVMIEVLQTIQQSYGVKLKVRRLLDDLTTIKAVAQHLDGELAPDVAAVPATPGDELEIDVAGWSENPSTTAGAPSVSSIEGIASFMTTQLELLSNVASQQIDVLKAIATPSQLREARGHVSPARSAQPDTSAMVPSDGDKTEPFVPHRSISVEPTADPTIDQALLGRFVERYSQRTAGSKRLAAQYRQILSDNDNRVVSNFRMTTKEIVYPIAADRTRGARLWDVDGNEYIDVVMGFGTNLFGHSEPLLVEAVQRQLSRGTHIGAQSDLAGEVAQLLSSMTGMDRVAFSNSGSEAVMTALRLARAATGRTKVAVFAGSYHGHFDGTLARREVLRNGRRGLPLAPGTPPGMVEDLLILDYGDPASFEELERHRFELAAVLVEPVQSRRPDLQPREFLQKLRAFTTAHDTPLVFDEIISGLRVAPGGAQEWFGIRADLATYGKVLGGGLPIGAIAGDARFLDWIDGGSWSYGDDSFPVSETTFFAGTFCKHPLAMATAKATLEELVQRGPGLQADLNARTSRLVAALNDCFAQRDLAIEAVSFGSLFRLASRLDIHMLFPAMVDRGVHIREGHNSFLSTAHTDEDVGAVVGAVSAALDEICDMGFLAGGDHRAKSQPPVKSSEPLPLTEAQRQLWLLSMMDDGASAAYNQVSAVRIRGELAVDALQVAVQEVVARHEALRTRVTSSGEASVEAGARIGIELVAGDEFGEIGTQTNSLAAAEAWIIEWSNKPFDLAEAPLVRAALLELGAGDHVLVFSAHHLVADGWSMGLILQEVAALYAGRSSEDLPEPVPFRTYATWLGDRLAGVDGDADIEFWADRLAPPLPTGELPADLERPPVRTFAGGRHTVEVDAELVGSLRELAAHSTSTLVMVLLSAWEVVLHRLTGANDLAIGIPVAGRDFRGAECIVGHCTNLLPHRSKVGSEMPFDELLAGVKASLLDELEHQDLPFGTLVKQLGVGLDPARTPLVDVVFNFDRRVNAPTLPGLDLETLILPSTSAQFDLMLNVVEVKHTLLIEFDYSADLFKADTIARWADMYLRVLREVVVAPTTVVGEIGLMSETEHKYLNEWANGENLDIAVSPLHALFEHQLDAKPDDVCVILGSETLTFRELDLRANAVAVRLVSMNVKPGDVVGVATDRSFEFYAAVIGVLKVGAAYSPVTVDLAPEAASNTGLSVVLTAGPWDGEVSHGLHVVDVSTVEASDAEPVRYPTDPDDAAFVIFTSGSTGAPKGVIGTHAAVVNRLAWMWSTFPFSAGDRACLRVNPMFVDGVAELFGPLLAGVPTVVVPPEVAADPSALVEELAAHHVSRITLVPWLLDVLLDAVESAGTRLESLRQCISSGEPLPRALSRRFHKLLPDATLLNLYGATEVMADVTWLDCSEVAGEEGAIPIGRPISNMRVYVFDDNMTSAPVGVAGAVYVGGPGLARGYLDAPAMTSECFIPDPNLGHAGERLYRTGDRARRRPDGMLEYLGRLDRQVKVNGIRVEPSDVESVLRLHPDVAACAVVAVRRPSMEQTLVAYVIPDGSTPDPGDVRTWAATRMPRHLIPSAVVVVEGLPKTETGKVDRNRLEARGFPGMAPVVVESPGTAMERIVHEIWCEVLGTDTGVNDGFLDLGGSSLSAMRVLVRLRSVLDVDVSPTDLFAAPSARTLAGILEDRLLAVAGAEVDGFLDKAELADSSES